MHDDTIDNTILTISARCMNSTINSDAITNGRKTHVLFKGLTIIAIFATNEIGRDTKVVCNTTVATIAPELLKFVKKC